jgi:predicted MFS family arabinose efflux permease
MFRLLHLYRDSFANIQRNVWILSVSMLINRSGSMVLLFTSLYLTKELNFTIAQAGLTMSFYGIGSVLGSYTGGWLTDRKNHFDIMVGSLLFSGMVIPCLLFTTTPFGVAAVLFVYSFIADAFRPANSKAIAEYSTPANRTRSVSLVRLAINLGFSVGPAIGGFIAMYLGYRWLFVIDALTSVLAAGMLYFYLPRHPNPQHSHATSPLADKSTSAYRDITYLSFILLVALYGICFFQLFASVPQYFSTVCKYNEDTIGLLLALNGFLVVIIEMPFISWLEKKQKIFPFIIAGVLCIPVCFIILELGGGVMIWALIYTLIITLSEILAMPFMMNYTLSRPPKERQGQYSALYSISYGIANIAAPLFGLGIADRFGFNNMFYSIIALGSLTALGFVYLQKKDREASLERAPAPAT